MSCPKRVANGSAIRFAPTEHTHTITHTHNQQLQPQQRRTDLAANRGVENLLKRQEGDHLDSVDSEQQVACPNAGGKFWVEVMRSKKEKFIGLGLRRPVLALNKQTNKRTRRQAGAHVPSSRRPSPKPGPSTPIFVTASRPVESGNSSRKSASIYKWKGGREGNGGEMSGFEISRARSDNKHRRKIENAIYRPSAMQQIF